MPSPSELAGFAASSNSASARVVPRPNTTGFGGLCLNEMTHVSQTNGQGPDEPTLIRYLVGTASDEEAEHFDELSIVDDEFVVRLRAVEYDLVDAYVNGELDGDTLASFKLQYLASASGLAKVEVARALQARPRTGGAATPITSPVRPNRQRLSHWWPMAAAALLAFAAAGYLFVDGLRLRREVTAIREQQAALEQRERQLQEDLKQQQSATAAATQELARARDALNALPDRTGTGRLSGILALMLPPATRGGGEPPTIAIPSDTTSVVLRLQLLAADFERYDVALKNAVSDRVIWRAARLRAPSASVRQLLSITVAADLLAPGAYAVELSGVQATGPSELLDSYPFRVVTPQ